MGKKHMTIREKLELQKQIKERNEQRMKEFAEQETAKKAYNEKLVDLYVEGRITDEQFRARIKR